MKIADIPTKIPVTWASGVSSTYVSTIPQAASPTPGRASFTTGFPSLNFEQIAAGGIPPFGKDMNGALQAVTQWLRWSQAGGVPVKYDSSFSSSVGGYPKGAFIQSATTGKFWISSVDDNTTNPDSGGANWISFPDLLIQHQNPNYGVDTGTVNQIVVTLSPAPTAWSDIVGAPIRVLLAYANSVNNPTVKINGLTPATAVNVDGSALGVGQLPAGGIMEGFPRADGKFQVNTPGPLAPSPSSSFVTGCIYLWPTESLPSSLLLANGALLTISSYPNLYAVLGTRYGGDGVNNFRLPDYRGQFIRGWDNGRGLDPNAGSRSNRGDGTTGDHVGTTQSGAAGQISLSGGPFTITDLRVNTSLSSTIVRLSDNFGAGNNNVTFMLPQGSPTSFNSLTGNISLSGQSGASETRPVNIYLAVCIAK